MDAPFRRRLVVREYPAPRNRTRRKRLTAGAAVVIVAAVFSMMAMNEQVGELVVPPATSGATSNASPETPAEQEYLQGLEPYLSVVIGEGKRLAELDQARSRNVLELGVRMDRFREASADLQAYVGTHEPPASLAPMVDLLCRSLTPPK